MLPSCQIIHAPEGERSRGLLSFESLRIFVWHIEVKVAWLRRGKPEWTVFFYFVTCFYNSQFYKGSLSVLWLCEFKSRSYYNFICWNLARSQMVLCRSWSRIWACFLYLFQARVSYVHLYITFLEHLLWIGYHIRCWGILWTRHRSSYQGHSFFLNTSLTLPTLE